MDTYQRILCATDFSDNCRVASERAVDMAHQCSAKLTFLHVVEYFPENRSNQVIAPEDVDPKGYRKQQAYASLEELVNDLGIAEAEHAVRFTTGSAGHVIVRFAKEHAFDLIVMATHGRHGITHILGATAYIVVHGAPCDILAVRSKVD